MSKERVDKLRVSRRKFGLGAVAATRHRRRRVWRPVEFRKRTRRISRPNNLLRWKRGWARLYADTATGFPTPSVNGYVAY